MPHSKAAYTHPTHQLIHLIKAILRRGNTIEETFHELTCTYTPQAKASMKRHGKLSTSKDKP